MTAKKGNKYAAKSDPKGAHLHVRCKQSQKDLWQAECERSGVSLAWVVCSLLDSWARGMRESRRDEDE
jgi:hypothetical protein